VYRKVSGTSLEAATTATNGALVALNSLPAGLFVVAAHPKGDLTQRNGGGNAAFVSVVLHPGRSRFRRVSSGGLSRSSS
jgi:hypothetical protein